MIVIIARNPLLLTRTGRSKSAICLACEFRKKCFAAHSKELFSLNDRNDCKKCPCRHSDRKASKSSSKLICHFFVSVSLLRLERPWLSPRLGAAAEAAEMAFKHKAHSRYSSNAKKPFPMCNFRLNIANRDRVAPRRSVRFGLRQRSPAFGTLPLPPGPRSGPQKVV